MSRADRKEYSIPSNNEEQLESDIEIKLSSLEWEFWKHQVDKDMRNLSTRLSALEGNGRNESVSKITLSQSYTTSREDGLGRLPTVGLLIRSNKAALLQCILLTIVIIMVSLFGIVEFIRAHNNVRAEFKPEKKFKTIDYRDSNGDEQYVMPYIYLWFGVHYDSSTNDGFDLSYEEINETLKDLLESQNYFENSGSITYMDENLNFMRENLPIVEAKAVYEEPWVLNDTFYCYFRLQPANPDPSRGSFQYTISIDPEGLPRDQTQWISGFYVAVARDMSTLIWEKAIYVPSSPAIYHGSKVWAAIYYDEKIIRKWPNGYVNYFTTTLGSYQELDWEVGEINITFVGNLMIEYWEEYVAYGYYDWISGLGGVLSISSILFFFGAYRLVKIFGEENIMGILPAISLAFNNLEKIHLLNERANIPRYRECEQISKTDKLK